MDITWFTGDGPVTHSLGPILIPVPVPGNAGASAYEVAVAAGFVGDEAAWLVSLQGEAGDDGLSAYEVALDNGFAGTEAEFLEALRGDPGPPGDEGPPGNPGRSITITTVTTQAAFDAAVPGPLELVVRIA